MLALYCEEQHGHLAHVLNNDPKTFGLVWESQATWMLGYPEEAEKISDAKDSHARRLGHPFDLGWALTTGAQVLDHLGKPEEHLKRAEEAAQLGREQNLPVLTKMLGPINSGVALIRKGQFVEGTALLEAGLAFWDGTGGRSSIPYLKSVLAEGKAQLGDVDGALALIDEILAQIEPVQRVRL